MPDRNFRFKSAAEYRFREMHSVSIACMERQASTITCRVSSPNTDRRPTNKDAAVILDHVADSAAGYAGATPHIVVSYLGRTDKINIKIHQVSRIHGS